MGNMDLSCVAAYGRFKSARRKTRLLKKDRNKQLIQLDKKRNELRKKISALPMIPLEEPYQRGWVRTFVLRQDVEISKDFEFFQTILSKLNTEQFSHKKMFQLRRKSNGKRIFVARPQHLMYICSSTWTRKEVELYDPHHYRDKTLQLTPKEKEYFSKKEILKDNGEYISVHYFNEAWRFVLKIKPNMVTHVKMHDRALAMEAKEIENYITQHHLNHKIERLVRGRKNNWWYSDRGEKKRLEYEYSNKSLHQILNKVENDFYNGE